MSKSAIYLPSTGGVPDQRIQRGGTNIATGTHRFWEALGVVGGFGFMMHAVLTLVFVNQGFIFRVFSWLELTIGLVTVTVDAWFFIHTCLPSCMQKGIDATQACDSCHRAAHPPSISEAPDREIQPVGTHVATGTHLFWEALAVVGGFGLILHAVLSLIFVSQGFIFRVLTWLELAAGIGTVAIDVWFITRICLPSRVQKDIDVVQAYGPYIEESLVIPTKIDE